MTPTPPQNTRVGAGSLSLRDKLILGIGSPAFLLLAVLIAILAGPPVPECKVCHCHRTSCHAVCSEENMCALRCEDLCHGRHQ